MVLLVRSYYLLHGTTYVKSFLKSDRLSPVNHLPSLTLPVSLLPTEKENKIRHANMSIKMTTDITEHTNEALASVDNHAHNHNTRHTGYSLDQSKLTKNLIKDATLNCNYDKVINNYGENLNLKSSSGFYLEVARPALLSLANQSSDESTR